MSQWRLVCWSQTRKLTSCEAGTWWCMLYCIMFVICIQVVIRRLNNKVVTVRLNLQVAFLHLVSFRYLQRTFACSTQLTQRSNYLLKYAKMTINNPVYYMLFCAKYEEHPKIQCRYLPKASDGYWRQPKATVDCWSIPKFKARTAALVFQCFTDLNHFWCSIVHWFCLMLYIFLVRWTCTLHTFLVLIFLLDAVTYLH